MASLRQRRKATPELERRTSVESYSSNSSSTIHRRTQSSGWFSIDVLKILRDDVSKMSSTANDAATTDPLNLCCNSNFRDMFLPLNVDTKDYSPERKIRRQSTCSDETGERSLSPHELEDLIRQLSFSPSRKREKSTDTADGDGSLSSFDSSDTHCKNTIRYLRRCSSSSPLMGLQFLPD